MPHPIRPNSMKATLKTLLACQLGLFGAALAGPTDSPETPVSIPAIPDPADDWVFTLSPYGWGAGLQGTVGVRGLSAEVDVPVDEVLKNLDMIAFLNFEARRGRWGAWVDGAYLKMSVGTEPTGPVFNSVALSIEQVMAEAALYYRVIDGPRGFLDLYTGARYVSVGGDLTLDVSDSGVTQASQKMSQLLVDQMLAAVQGGVQSKLSSKTNQVRDELVTQAKEKITDYVTGRVGEVRGRVEDIRQWAEDNPRLVDKIKNDEDLQQALKEAAAAQIQARLAEIQQGAADASTAAAAAKAQLQSAAGRARSRAEKALAKAEKKLADKLARALRDAIPDQISGSAAWVDPFFGMRAQYQLTDRLYAIGKADIGGFGVSSDLVWQVYGALGYQLTQSGNTTVEIGYRHMALDYARGNLVYDVSFSGAMLSLGFKF